jgi:coenzyme PQQ synthesis protein D (PqqD)
MAGIFFADHSRVEVVPEQVSCDLAGEAVILSLKSGVYFGLDPVGARIWSLIQEPTTFADLRIALLREYDVDTSCLESDLRELLGELAGRGLIEVTQ